MRSAKVSEELVYLDRSQLEQLRVANGLSMHALKKSLAKMSNVTAPGSRHSISPNVVDKVFRGEGVWPDVAKFLADYFECGVLELLAPHDPRYLPPVEVASGVPWEWELDEILEPGGYRASNGLHFFLCRMRHRHTANRLGRGKFYLLSGLSSTQRAIQRTQLQRHADICHSLGRHPQLAENESSTPIIGEAGWWVVDRWLEARTLADRLRDSAWPAADLPRLMKEIAAGLARLHAAKVIMRELAPSRVLITIADEQPVLTDFELAKLLTGAPTVSPSGPWPDDPYRAPEVESGDVSFASDLYSWARILVHAACGSLPPKGEELAALTKSALPKSVWGIARDCLARAPEDRPQSIADVQQALRRWSV